MVYSVAWNEASPVGATTPAADLDAELQNLKISIRERMDNLIGSGNWANDAVDPKVGALGNYWYGESTTAWTSAGVDADSNTFAFTETASAGTFTVGATGVDLDVAGTYVALAFISYGTGQQVIGFADFFGPAAIFTPTTTWLSSTQVPSLVDPPTFFSPSGSSNADLSQATAVAIIQATAGETIDFKITERRVTTFIGGALRVFQVSLLLLKIA